MTRVKFLRPLLLLAVLTVSGCVTTPTGQKQFNPVEAAKRADDSIDVFLDKHNDMPYDNPKGWNDN